MVRRISLPKTDDGFMPAEGEPLPKEQLALIKKWIDEGAVWLGTAIPKESARAKPAGPAGPELPKSFKPSGAEEKAVAALAQKGIDLRPITMNHHEHPMAPGQPAPPRHERERRHARLIEGRGQSG